MISLIRGILKKKKKPKPKPTDKQKKTKAHKHREQISGYQRGGGQCVGEMGEGGQMYGDGW